MGSSCVSQSVLGDYASPLEGRLELGGWHIQARLTFWSENSSATSFDFYTLPGALVPSTDTWLRF